MISTKVYLSEETREALRELAEVRGTSQSALIREALESFLEGADTTDAPSSPDEDEALENLRAARGIWKDRENVHEEFREIRESMDRDVWARARDHHSDDDMTEDPDDA
jgi:predicted transcriptional regulator